MDLKKVHKQGGDEKVLQTLPHYGMMPAPYQASNAMHLHLKFNLLLTQQSKLGMQVLCFGGQRGGRHRSELG